MEKILAIETSGKTLGVALAEEGYDHPHPRALASKERGESGGRGGKTRALQSCRIIGEVCFDVGLRHSEILKDCCAFLMEKCHWQKTDLTTLAVSTGPGSFTGLRVGIAFARALAQALDLPLLGIPTFEVLASALQEKWGFIGVGGVGGGGDGEGGKKIGILIDSIGNEVFAGFFKGASLKPIKPYGVYTIEQLCKNIKTMDFRFGRNDRPGGIILAGPALERHEKEIRATLGQNFVLKKDREGNIPQASILAKIALEKMKRFKPTHWNWEKVTPFYLRRPIAIERAAHYRKRSQIPRVESTPERNKR
jgi:tRNA threonylcarbamoyl adenosine modification protein YeaZ